MSRLKIITTIISAALLTPVTSNATDLNNGNFQTGNFASWSQDVDGFGTPIFGLNDFTIVEPTAGDYAARIETDYWSTTGDTSSAANDEAFFASTLYQGLDLTASAGQNLVLSFNWTFSGQSSIFDENFLVALGDGTGDYYGADGNLGFLLNPADYGSGNYSTTLDAAFNNALDWSLEFQLNTGFDGYGSNITIDNVQLTAVSAVPVPAAFWLMGSAIIGLAGIQRKKQA